MATSKRSSNKPAFLRSLVHTAYLPTEVPPAITTKYFAEFCEKQFWTLEQNQKALRKSTRFDTFSSPRTRKGRRTLALVHPLSQAGISLLITTYRSKIKKIIETGGMSLYRTAEDARNSKAFLGLDFRRKDVLAAQLYSKCSFVLKADISRFFYTAYTHSLPWAILGKERVKDWLANSRPKLEAHWSGRLDQALQSCQSRETFGIPVGPDTSRVVAELLLAGVEADSEFSELIKGKFAFRLLDDFMIGFDEESEAHRALSILRKVLWKFNLQLNEEKTGVSRSSALFEDQWKLEFDAIELSMQRPELQKRDIHRMVDTALRYCAQTGDSRPAIWACVRLSRLPIMRANFEIVVNALLRFARDFPACTARVAEFFVNHQRLCREPSIRRRIEGWAKAVIRSNHEFAHDFELSWCLIVVGVLKIHLSKDDFGSADWKPNSVVLAILGMLRERRLLSFSLSVWDWRAELKKAGIYGEKWLPFYEAVLRGWTKDKSMVAAVTGDPILSRMLASKVTFLENQVFDATSIDISQRAFKKAPSTKGRKTVRVERESEDGLVKGFGIDWGLGDYD